MLQKTITICLLLLSIVGFSQITDFKAPDYSSIEKDIQDTQSDYYYPQLMQQLKTGTAVLTASQYEHLYYGYVFQTAYNPYAVFSKDEELDTYYKKEPDMEDIPRLQILLREALDEFPFDFTAMMFLSYIYHLNGEEEKSELLSKHFEGFAKAIMASGDGLTCETGLHVIAVEHEHHMLQLFDLQHISQSFDGTCDFLTLDPEYYTLPGIYFNVSQLQKKNPAILKSNK